MKLIIDIDEQLYKQIYSDAEIMIYGGMRSGKTLLATLLRAIRNSIPLPKGHGRLIDADELANNDHLCDGISCTECPFENFREHTCRMCNFIKAYPAIIEADKENRNETDN